MIKKIYCIATMLSFLILSDYASGDGITIAKIHSESIPFSEMRDAKNDSLYNAFDVDPKTSALFSDFSIQFNIPLAADELKIINGNSRQFKQFSRLHDVEITLYTLKTTEQEKKKKHPDKKNIKDNKKSYREVTTLSMANEVKPVTAILNNPLAEEPVQISESEVLQEDTVVSGNTDIRDSMKTSAAEKKSSDKQTPVNKKKNSLRKDKKTVSDEKKTLLPAATVKKEAVKKTELKKDKIPENNDIPFKKMEGMTMIENDSEGRVIINVSLKDIPGEQTIKFGKIYTITAIAMRKRDDSNYPGSNSELSYFSDVNFYNKGKRLVFQGLDSLKKDYEERFIKALDISIAGKIFSAFDQEKEITRVFFKKNGTIEIRDRFKCLKNTDPDCTSASLPDMWMIRDGNLYMRYKKEWMPWKYELEYISDIMNGAESDYKQWLKLHYRNENGFSENFIYLEMSKNQKWLWN